MHGSARAISLTLGDDIGTVVLEPRFRRAPPMVPVI
jgi:hypothetical protein